MIWYSDRYRDPASWKFSSEISWVTCAEMESCVPRSLSVYSSILDCQVHETEALRLVMQPHPVFYFQKLKVACFKKKIISSLFSWYLMSAFECVGCLLCLGQCLMYHRLALKSLHDTRLKSVSPCYLMCFRKTLLV